MGAVYTTYRLKTNDLNIQFIESLKTLFRDQEVEIIVSPIDPTAYLLQSEANRRRLLAAIENVNAGRNLVEVPLDMLQ
jgi:antitoxin YefM